MSAMPTGPGNDPGAGRGLTGCVLVPASWVEHYERLLEEHDDAEAVRISGEVEQGREQVFTHDEVWEQET